MEHWLGTVGYTLSALAYLSSFLLLIYTRTNSKQSRILVSVFGISAIWSVGFALQSYYISIGWCIFFVETIRNLLWMFTLLFFLQMSDSLLTLMLGGRVRIFISLVILLSLIIELLGVPLTSLRLFFTLHLIQSIFVLTLIEQLYRRTDNNYKLEVRPLCLGLGLIYTYDIAFFSDALLTQVIDISIMYGRGWISLISVPLVLFTIRRIHNWSIRIYVSRDIVFHSTLIIVAGVYLLAMALVGYLIKYLGYSWSSVVQYVFIALSCSILVSLFLSEPLRRKIKVFIVKHFYANKYDYREEWMRFADTLDSGATSPYTLALSSLLKPFGCEQGVLFEFKNGRLEERAKVNVDRVDHLLSLSDLAKSCIEYDWIIDIDELNRDKMSAPFHITSIDTKLLGALKYMVPIVEQDNSPHLCLLSRVKTTNEFNFEDRDLMKVIAKQLSVFINLHVANVKLAENQQFNAFNQMSTFLVHDLKNVLAQLELLSKNAEKHKNNPDFIEDAFVTVSSASARLSKVLSHLRKRRIHDNKEEMTDLRDAVVWACEHQQVALPKPIFDDKFGDSVFISVDKERIRSVFSHLIQNSQDATHEQGLVKISRIDRQGYFGVSIEDNGIGMSQEFIKNRLFKPFETTKGGAGMGIGAYDAKKFIEQLNGYIDVYSEEGVGSRFDVYIPVS